MEYDPKQLEILMQKKVAFTLGSNFEGLLFQQKNILDNHLNNLMLGQFPAHILNDKFNAMKVYQLNNYLLTLIKIYDRFMRQS